MKNKIFHDLAELYNSHFGDRPTEIIPLKGDGSDRLVFRLLSEKHRDVIGVYGPNDQENEAFISFSRSFKKINLPVPTIIAYHPVNQIYLEDDLGDLSLFDWCNNALQEEMTDEIVNLYKKVLTFLIQFQLNGHKAVDYSKCYQFSTFTNEAIQYDLNYFLNSFLIRFVRKKFDRKALEKDFTKLIHHLIQEKSDYFLYRDFQSRNIMITNNHLHFIDYQSGRAGALQYDVASLLFDANLRISNQIRDELLEFYLESVSALADIEPVIFKSFYYDFALVRMLQALAAFSHLALDKGKMYFLKNIPMALENILTLIDKDCFLHSMPELKRVFIQDILVNPNLVEMKK